MAMQAPLGGQRMQSLRDLGPDSPRRVGQAGIAELDSKQRKLLSRAVDTAILKVRLAGECGRAV